MQVLTADQIAFYQENGFLQIDNVLSDDETNRLSDYIDAVMSSPANVSTQTSTAKESYYRVLNQRVNTWRDHAGMNTFAFHPRLAEMARLLAGSPGIRFFHDHALLKMPQDSKPTPWHQDFPYWPMNEPDALSIWIALDDVNEQNGCMMFIPGSHKLGKLPAIDLVNPQDIYEYTRDTQIGETRPVIARMRRGSCTFHHGLTFHYAHANVTDGPRRAYAIIYMPDGTTYSGQRHIITDGAGQTVGQPLGGPLMPRLA